MRRALAIAGGSLLVFALVTIVALEGREVVVVETTDAHGAARRTRTWVADEGRTMWIEAANPERPFVEDLRRRPALVLERAGTRRQCRAEILPNPEGHVQVREALARRYGWADRWIGMLADTHASLAVRLSCA